LFELTADKSQLHHQCRTANNKTLTPTRKQWGTYTHKVIEGAFLSSTSVMLN
jgi:hypothetical protein